VKVDIRLNSGVLNQSSGRHIPWPSPVGTTAATVLLSSLHFWRGSKADVLVMPELPARSLDQVRLMPTPSGVMAPRPVTTTRRILSPYAQLTVVELKLY
jgi:hypothetical protein